MITSIRLGRAFSRLGITLSYEDGGYHLSSPQSSARVLLPPSLQLEEKAVQQLLAFASVRTPDGSRQVCAACATPDFHPGNLAPVGTIVATPDDLVIPASIGSDIDAPGAHPHQNGSLPGLGAAADPRPLAHAPYGRPGHSIAGGKLRRAVRGRSGCLATEVGPQQSTGRPPAWRTRGGTTGMGRF